MKNLDPSDKLILASAHPMLQRLVEDVNRIVPTRVLEAHRSEARQALAFKKGNSKTLWGKHNTMPSLAVDMLPEVALDKNGSVRWNDRDDFTLFAGFVLGRAQALGIPLRWGGDWDGDYDTNDNSFDDLVHFELDIPLPSRPVAKPAPKIKIASAFAPDVVGDTGAPIQAGEVPAFLAIEAEDGEESVLDLHQAMPLPILPLSEAEISALRALLSPTNQFTFKRESAVMEDVKGIFQSKTIWGILVAGLPLVLGFFGVTITPDDASSLLAHIDKLITAGGLAWAAYGRIVAKTRLS
jgi:peptidoglycan LD-endopeptidase CwlK